MKKFAIAIVVTMLATGSAFAATQQEKMKSCNAEAKAKSLKGAERREFMSQCLSATPEEKAARVAQQEKLKSCTAEAKAQSLRGEERRKFISECSAA
jgi:predicted ATP-binding protein involved in virulence